nr:MULTISPECIES: MFS transporter [Bacteroidales]
MHPAFNTIFVRLTDEKHRGAATSMFFTSNDLGIGIGVLAGGMVSQLFGGYFAIFGIGTILCIISLAIFLYKIITIR